MKKLGILFLCVSLLYVPLNVQAKENNNETVSFYDEAYILYNLRYFRGYGDFPYSKEYLNEHITRDVAIKRALSFIGEEVDIDKVSQLDDVADWAQPFVQTAIDANITSGQVSSFYGSRVATVRELLTWYLRALGYNEKEAWDNAEQISIKIGLLKAEDKIDISTPLTTDLQMGISYNLLTTYALGHSDTIIEQQVDRGYIHPDRAIESGLVEPIEVTSIKALNMAQTQVNFNRTLDSVSATNKVNYSIQGKSIRNIIMGNDKKSVIITHTGVFYNLERKVIVSDINSFGSEKDSCSFEQVVEYSDREAPTIKSVKAIGWDILEVEISEPIKYIDYQKIHIKNLSNEQKYNVSFVSAPNKNYSYMRDANSDGVQEYGTTFFIHTTRPLKKGEYTVKFDGIVDYGKNKLMPIESKIVVQLDKNPPKLISSKILDKNTVVFEFDKYFDIGGYNLLKEEIESGSDNNPIYHTHGKKVASNIKLVEKTLTVTFPHESSIGTGTSYFTIASEHLKDYWGNIMGTVVERIDDIKY